MANMSGKFDEEAHKGLVSIVFTSLFPYMCIVTLTFDLHAPCTDRTTAALQYSFHNKNGSITNKACVT